MVWEEVRLGKRVRKNGCLCLGMRPEGLACLGVENGTSRVGILRRQKAPQRVSKKRQGSKYGRKRF